MANYVLFKNWIRTVIFPKIATLAFAKHYSLHFGFAVIYDLAQNTSYHSSNSVQMRIYIYKRHELLFKIAYPIANQVYFHTFLSSYAGFILI